MAREHKFELLKPDTPHTRKVKGLALLRDYPSPLVYWNWPGIGKQVIQDTNQHPALLNFGKMCFQLLYRSLLQTAATTDGIYPTTHSQEDVEALFSVFDPTTNSQPSKGSNEDKREEKSLKKEEGERPLVVGPGMSWDPDSLNAILYPTRGKMNNHIDGPLGWVLSVSIGNTAIFEYQVLQQEREKEAEKEERDEGTKGEAKSEGAMKSLELESGDVVLFQGAKMFHGVKDIRPGTAPAFWAVDGEEGTSSPSLSEQERLVYSFSRLNLQYRDCSHIPSASANGRKVPTSYY